MLSHDLARELLARRNNDVRISALLDVGNGDLQATLVELRHEDEALAPEYRHDPVVGYDAYADVVVIRAGSIVTDPGDGERAS